MIKLTSENYFSPESNKQYMSVSQFKAFENCPASTLAELRGTYTKPKSTALLVGSYVDAHFEGSLGLFKAQNPEIFTLKGDLRADYRNAERIINRAEQDGLFMSYMEGEKQVIMTGEIEGVPVKIKIDAYQPNICITDLKCMKDFKPIYVEEKGRLNFVEAWGYDLQGAVYQEIVRQNTGKQLPFFICAITKEAIPDLAVIEIPQSYLDVELERFKKNVQLYDGMKKGIFPAPRCEKCDFCKETKVLTKPISLAEMEFD